MKLILEIELEYDEDQMYGDTPEGWEWFRDEILQCQAPGSELVMHSNEVGDEIGIVKVLKITKP